MEKKLEEQVKGPSLEKIKEVVEELKKAGVNPIRGQRGMAEAQTSLEVPESNWNHKENRPLTGQREQTPLSDLIQEKMRLEKILQELNNLKSKICQRIGLIKTIERREKELEQQLASVRKENDFSDQVKKKFENLRENIKPR